jgi:hypothetical protein
MTRPDRVLGGQTRYGLEMRDRRTTLGPSLSRIHCGIRLINAFSKKVENQSRVGAVLRLVQLREDA